MNRRFAFISAILAAYGCISSPKDYVERGNKFFEQGKFEDASLNFRKAIQKDAKFGEAYRRLSLSELRQRKVNDGFQALKRGAELMPDNNEVQVELADLSVQLYQADQRRPKVLYDQVVKTVSQLEVKSPGGYDTFRLRGYVHLMDRKVKDGIESLQKANQVKPMQGDVVFALAQALIQDQRAPEAEKLGLELIQKSKEYSPVYDFLYQHYMGGKRIDDAEKILQTKSANNPKQADYALQLALHYARTQKRTEMAATLKRLLDQSADFPRAYLQVGNFYAGMGNWEEATRLFDEGAKRNPKDKVVYLKRTTAVLLAQDKKQDAARVVDAILKESPKDGESLRMRAALLMDTRKPENIDKALVEFQALAKETPNDVLARFNLGRAYLAKNNIEEGRKELLEALRLNRLFLPARLLVAEVALQRRDVKELLAQANEILAAQPAHPRGRWLHATASIGLGNSAEARNELTRLVKDQPKYADAHLQLALLDLTEKKYKEAEDIFRQFYQPGQADLRALGGLVNVLLARNQPDRAVQLLTDDLKVSKQPAPVRLMLAQTALGMGKIDLGIDQLQQLVKENPQSAGAHLRLADVLSRKGDLNQALPLLEKARDLAPKDPAVFVLLGSLHERMGRKPEAIATYRRVLELQPDNPAVLNNLAFLLTETGGNLDEALKMSQRALEKMRDQPNFSDTLGWIYLKKNMHDSALQIFNNLVKKRPENAIFHYHLGMTLFLKGDKAKARVVLNDALAKKPTKELEAQIRETLKRVG
jgi:tetratricopeptide (TPR) repeat protein